MYNNYETIDQLNDGFSSDEEIKLLQDKKEDIK
jgi:hypothetical protein